MGNKHSGIDNNGRLRVNDRLADQAGGRGEGRLPKVEASPALLGVVEPESGPVVLGAHGW
ncbi:hypothetical protein J6590_054580 [Homalodisca vitripennis]|nr:hypothetical protein J6590_054580 [Homalodisca vitripennis]